MFLFFCIIIGEDWNKVMYDCMLVKLYCMENVNFWESDCGFFVVVCIYFMLFYLIVMFVFLNFFIVVIIENFLFFYFSDEDFFISNIDL